MKSTISNLSQWTKYQYVLCHLYNSLKENWDLRVVAGIQHNIYIWRLVVIRMDFVLEMGRMIGAVGNSSIAATTEKTTSKKKEASHAPKAQEER